VQLIIAVAAVVLSGVVTTVVGLALGALLGWRVGEADEAAGLDRALHGESSYDWSELVPGRSPHGRRLTSVSPGEQGGERVRLLHELG
jgi:Amt family ammonium transporter